MEKLKTKINLTLMLKSCKLITEFKNIVNQFWCLKEVLLSGPLVLHVVIEDISSYVHLGPSYSEEESLALCCIIEYPFRRKSFQISYTK